MNLIIETLIAVNIILVILIFLLGIDLRIIPLILLLIFLTNLAIILSLKIKELEEDGK